MSLWFGRNEDNGLRCPITAGNTTTPASASRCRRSRPKVGLLRKIKLKSYPLIERGGDSAGPIWGRRELEPPLPEFEWVRAAGAPRFVTKRSQECNYLQAMEGGIDSSHVSFLHSPRAAPRPRFKVTKGAS